MLTRTAADTGMYTPSLPSEAHFLGIRNHTIGIDCQIDTPYGQKTLLYADWAASGRLYRPIEYTLQEKFGPLVGNPHTEASTTGLTMTRAYHEAKQIIKRHVNAAPYDALIFAGNGTTGAVNKLRRILGLPADGQSARMLGEADRPVIFVSHMEHHSNQLPWLETGAELVTVPAGPEGCPDPAELERLLGLYRTRRWKIGTFTACSNVTGIESPYHRLAAAMHRAGGICFVDFAASAPYTALNMHPERPEEKLDAIFFSPHKFLGGPGAGGVLVFDSRLYAKNEPDEPGGGTVIWTNPWGGRSYIPDVEVREDGGTPGFMQAFRTALCVKLKEQMGARALQERERQLTSRLLEGLDQLPGITVLEGRHKRRLGIVSFTVHTIHYNLMVRLLNDRFGIQARGGCSCAGPYGHHLLGVSPVQSSVIASQLSAGNPSLKPGWVRFSIHPMMTAAEVDTLVSATAAILHNRTEWTADYQYDPLGNSWVHRTRNPDKTKAIEDMFQL